MTLPVIAWDVDDVLNNFTEIWLNYFNSTYNKDISFGELKKNPPHHILGVPRQDYLDNIDDFRGEMMSTLKPYEPVMKWFEQNGEHYRHVAVTAAPLKFAHFSAEWVLKHYSRWIRTFHIVPSKRNEDNFTYYDSRKADFLQCLSKVDLFIDDTPKNFDGTKELNIKTMAFPRPWNNNHQLSSELFFKQVNQLLQKSKA